VTKKLTIVLAAIAAVLIAIAVFAFGHSGSNPHAGWYTCSYTGQYGGPSAGGIGVVTSSEPADGPCNQEARLIIQPQYGGIFAAPASGNVFDGSPVACAVNFPTIDWTIYGTSRQAQNLCTNRESVPGATTVFNTTHKSPSSPGTPTSFASPQLTGTCVVDGSPSNPGFRLTIRNARSSEGAQSAPAHIGSLTIQFFNSQNQIISMAAGMNTWDLSTPATLQPGSSVSYQVNSEGTSSNIQAGEGGGTQPIPANASTCQLGT
jgi:hypothetical protein